MPRYIDAELIDLGCVSDSICEWQAQEAIDDTPTADVVEVVRCKDCVHRHQTTCPFLIANAYKASSDDDFCSRGKRREE